MSGAIHFSKFFDYVVKCLLVIGSLLVSLVVLEGGARIMDGAKLFTFQNWVTTQLEENTSTRTAEYDSRLGWGAVPNLELTGDSANNPDAPDYSHLLVTTNDHGYRFTGEVADLAHPDAPPIIAVGDSFTWGSEVTDTDAYPAHLQVLLQRPVINAAYGGWGTDQIWLRAQEVAERENPAMLILSPLTNDVLRNAYRRYGRAFKPHYSLETDGTLRLENVPVPVNSSDPRDIGWVQWAFGRLYLATVVANALGYQEVWINRNRLNDRIHDNETAVTIACALVEDARQWSERTEIPVVFALLYGGGEVLSGDRHWFTQDYRSCIQEAGLPLIDLWETLFAASQSDSFPGSHYRVWKAGQVAHMNPDGNAHVADVIARELRSMGLLNP